MRSPAAEGIERQPNLGQARDIRLCNRRSLMAVDQWRRNREHRCDRHGKQSRAKALCEIGNYLHNSGSQHCLPLRQKNSDTLTDVSRACMG
jgi:hypothetical protein